MSYTVWKMPQGGKKTPFSGKLKKAQLQAKRERKVTISDKEKNTVKPLPCRREGVATWANILAIQALGLVQVMEKEMVKNRMLGRAATSRYGQFWASFWHKSPSQDSLYCLRLVNYLFKDVELQTNRDKKTRYSASASVCEDKNHVVSFKIPLKVQAAVPKGEQERACGKSRACPQPHWGELPIFHWKFQNLISLFLGCATFALCNTYL